MKDYSKIMMYPESFIEDIKIEGDNISVKFTGAKKPQSRKLTDENIDLLYKRLSDQYLVLMENKNSAFNKFYNKRIIKFIIFSLLFVLLINLLPFFVINAANLKIITLVLKFLCSFCIGSTIVCGVEFLNESHKFKNIKYLLNNTEIMNLTIENLLKESDESEISKDTIDAARDEEALMGKGNIANINLADHLSRRDFDTIVERTEIEKGLQHPVTLAKPKSRVRKLVLCNKQIERK